MVATVLSLIDGPTPLLGQIVHFQFYLALGWAAWIGVFLLFGRHKERSQIRRGALLTGLLALIWHGHTWAGPLGWPTAYALDQPDKTLRVMWANVQHEEAHIQRLIEVIKQENPDVVGLGEAVHGKALKQLLLDYPYSIEGLENGLILCSRLPWVQTERIDVPKSRPILRGELQWQGQRMHVFAVHALWPTQSAHLESCFAAATLSRQYANSVFMGDWNTTPWAPSFRYLIQHSDLRDARQGGAAWATWGLHQMPWVRLPIDHLFFGGDLKVGNFRVGPEFGSDHNPILAEIWL